MWGRGGGESHGLIFDHPRRQSIEKKKSPQAFLILRVALSSGSLDEQFPQLILIIRAGGGLMVD